MLNDPEPPPQPWRIRALGLASVVVVVTSSVVAVVTGGGGSDQQRKVAARTPFAQPASVCDPDKGHGLPGLGAAPLDWGSTHTAAYSPLYNSTRWNSSPRLPRFHGYEGAVYNHTLMFRDCVIASYYIQLVAPTSPKAALQRAKRELPSDARLLWRRDLRRCAQYEFVSDRLDGQLAKRGTTFIATSALVRLIKSRPGSPTAVQRVALSLNDAPPPVDAGGCKY
jgi:hypothetical protein